MKIELREIQSFRKQDLKDLISNDISGFQLLEMGDHMSLWKFFCAVAGNIKPDVFVTQCHLLLENRDNIKKNTKIKIMTLEEVTQQMKNEAKAKINAIKHNK